MAFIRGTKYCEKHNQWYKEWLKGCPICAGEKIKVIGREKIETNYPGELTIPIMKE